jgi:hypothetical protein
VQAAQDPTSLIWAVRRAERIAFSDAVIGALSVEALADGLVCQLVEQIFRRPALMKLLDAEQDWSVKREEFKSASRRRIAKSLLIHSPSLSKKPGCLAKYKDDGKAA